MEIFGVNDRLTLERDVLKGAVESEFYRKESLRLLQQGDLESPQYRNVYSEIQCATVNGTPYNYAQSSFPEAIADILSEGTSPNGTWSQAIERLKVHSFDRTDFPLTDLGNAERFEQAHGAEVRYDHTRGQWLLWRRGRWQADETGEVFSLMADNLRDIYKTASSLETEAERKGAAKWALQCESRSKMTDALALVKNLPKIRSRSVDFDRDSLLVNCPNGTLDLRRNTFRPHIHNDLLTKSLNVEYNDTARCKWWEGFLAEIFDGDAELISFIQRSAGYALSGLTDEQYLWFLHGGGMNGKTSFVKILSMIVGSYHQNAPANMLLLRKGDNASNDIARVHGARLVICQEIEAGRRLAEGQVKSLTGGDRMTARFLYGEYFEFEPTHKLWLIANHKPIVVGTDEAIWRRVLLIPFEKQIKPDKRRPLGELIAEARKEGPGILNWLIEGWAAYKAEGLKIPERVRLASKAYREESDSLEQFLQQCTKEGGQVSSSALYQAFKEWAGPVISQRAFFSSMQERGVEIQGKRPRYWQGISLPEDA
jgi:putative DNA primase/helicase